MGCLYRLTRDELQAVIAHGFSDLMHRDPALRVRLAALVGGLQGVSNVGLFLLVPVRPRSKGGGVNPFLLPLYPLNAVLGLSLLVTGGLGWLLGELLGAAVMRRRILAGDLAACYFTRNPLALAGALSKVGGFVFGSRLLSPSARDYRHLFLCRTSGPTTGVLDAHPRLRDRVSSIDPSWNGSFAPSRIDTWLADVQAADR
jgi:Zn-dependent protease with chaperone function